MKKYSGFYFIGLALLFGCKNYSDQKIQVREQEFIELFSPSIDICIIGKEEVNYAVKLSCDNILIDSFSIKSTLDKSFKKIKFEFTNLKDDLPLLTYKLITTSQIKLELVAINKENKIKVSSSVCFISYIVSSTLLFTISNLLLKSHHPYRAFVFLSYNNPIIIIQSLALFLSFKQLIIKRNRKINFIAHYVFAAYLIPESFTDILYPLQAKLFDKSIILGFCSVLTFFFLCILIDYFRERLYIKIRILIHWRN